MSQVMSRLMETNRLHLEINDFEGTVNPLLLSLVQGVAGLPGKQQVEVGDNFKQREVAFWVLKEMIVYMEAP